ncbi:MAG: flagellar biosynthesis protein FlhA [bacterium]
MADSAAVPAGAAAVPALQRNIARFSDLGLAVGFLVVLGMVLVPLPRLLFDTLLIVNLAGTVVVLLVTMYTLRPLDFAVFPAMLLVGTLYRLALNLSATRLILLHGHEGEHAAGAVIQTFGQFVVGGNYVVGAVVFLILVVIQFVVITSGAQRVAEVAARFTLDAMPGKQMAIDADLNAGLISEQDARTRRRDIEREADFYGAMDGASKFVRGDAIAAILILIVNILGGFAIGVLQRGMTLMDALSRYTILTIGDGLVTQIPALILSVATGLVVTRAASETAMGQDMARQLLGQDRPLWLAAGVVGVFGTVVGLVAGPAAFLVSMFLAGGLGALAWSLGRSRQQAAAATATATAAKSAAPREPENVMPLLQVDPIELEIGYGLIPLVEEKQGGDLLERIATLRRTAALELGLVVPPIRVRDNVQLGTDGYAIKIKGVEVVRGQVRVGRYFAINAARVTEALEGEAAKDPSFGLPAWWIGPEQRERAEHLGYTVVDLASVIATHLSEIVRGQADELLGRQEVQKLLDSVKSTHPAVVEELVPHLLSVGEIQKVLQGLLRERVAIRDLVTILESLADAARGSRDIDALIEAVRQSLKRQITKQHAGEGNVIRALTLDPRLEQRIIDAVQRGAAPGAAAVDPRLGQQLFGALSRETEKVLTAGHLPLVLCSPPVRPVLRRLLEKALPQLTILSYNELMPRVEVQSVGIVALPDAN